MFLKGNGLSLVICAAALMGCAEFGSTLVIGDQSGGQDPSEATGASDTDDPAVASDTADPSTLDDPATVLCRYHVAPEGSESGESWDMPSDLAAALSNLAGHLAQGECESGEVWMKAGTYTPGPDQDDSFELASGMTLYGGFTGNETTVGQRNLSQQTSILSGDLLSNLVQTGMSSQVGRGGGLKIGKFIGNVLKIHSRKCTENREIHWNSFTDPAGLSTVRTMSSLV